MSSPRPTLRTRGRYRRVIGWTPSEAQVAAVFELAGRREREGRKRLRCERYAHRTRTHPVALLFTLKAA